ncbi:hypothetical protein HMPREF1498_1309 [Fusobacterium sp. CM1]|nr:hypothetical protein HMPREF1498_1309 [Fusobacterium sp. CM1]
MEVFKISKLFKFIVHKNFKNTLYFDVNISKLFKFIVHNSVMNNGYRYN